MHYATTNEPNVTVHSVDLVQASVRVGRVVVQIHLTVVAVVIQRDKTTNVAKAACIRECNTVR